MSTRSSSSASDHQAHLAVLDIVTFALDTAMWALIDDFPALHGDPHPWRPDPPDQRAARHLLRQAIAFARALDRYRSALVAVPASQPPAIDDLDF